MLSIKIWARRLCREKRLNVFFRAGKSEAVASRTGIKKESLVCSQLKSGPGGIRTHDQGIMSPLRYRCATGPWRLIHLIVMVLGSAVALALSFPSASKDNQSFSRSPCHRPVTSILHFEFVLRLVYFIN